MDVRIEHVSFLYASPVHGERQALTDVSLVVPDGTILGIVGASGSGKTTLVQLFNGLLKPTEGRVCIGSEELHRSGCDLNRVRRNVGLAFQFPEGQLFEESVFEDVAFGPRSIGLSEVEIKARVHEALELVGLPVSRYGDRSPFSLSGGERRRAALAGILVMNPRILVLDEPTAGLDNEGTRRVEGLIREYHDRDRTVVCVSHHMDFIARLVERIVVLSRGEILFDGVKEQLFENEDLLKKAGLELPSIPRFLKDAIKKGLDVPIHRYSIEDAESVLKNVTGR